MALTGVLRALAAGPPAAAAVDILERLVPRRPDSLAVLTFHRVAPPGVGRRARTAQRDPGRLLRAARYARQAPRGDLSRRPHPALERRPGPPASVIAAHVRRRVRRLRRARLAGAPRPRAVGRPLRTDRLPGRSKAQLLVGPYPSGRFDVVASLRSMSPSGELSLGSAQERVDAYRAIRGCTQGDAPRSNARGRRSARRGARRRAARERSCSAGPSLRDAGRRGGRAGAAHADTSAVAPPGRRRRSTPRSRVPGRTSLARRGRTCRSSPIRQGRPRPRVAEAVAAAGLRIAFTTARGVNDLRTASWLALRRINVSVRTPRSAVRVQAVR